MITLCCVSTHNALFTNCQCSLSANYSTCFKRFLLYKRFVVVCCFKRLISNRDVVKKLSPTVAAFVSGRDRSDMQIYCRGGRIVCISVQRLSTKLCQWISELVLVLPCSFPSSLPKLDGPELVTGHFFKTQPNPQKSSPDPTQPIIDTWYGILGYTENFKISK